MFDFNEILGLLTEKTGKSKAEISEMLEERKKKYAGLLTEQGAIFLLAKELKVHLEEKQEESNTLKISDLRSGLKNVDLIVSIKKIFNEKSFEKNKKKGKLASIIVFDDSGEIRLSLWNKETELINSMKMERGNKLKLSNCIVSDYAGKQQLSLGYNGKIEVIEKKTNKINKINELREEMQDIDTAGIITRKFKTNYFEFQGEERKALNFELQDETGKIKCTAWNDLAEKITGISEGTLIKIEGAYTKKGSNALELHLGWNSRIIENYWLEIEKPKELLKNFKRFSLKELQTIDAENNVEAKATIVSIKRNDLHYKACRKCGKKLKQIENVFVCDNCGEIKDAAFKTFINLLIDDGTASMNAVAFGSTARKLEVKEEELKEYIENERLNEYLDLIENKILGKTFLLQGRTKRNAFSNEIELIVDDVKEVNIEREADVLLKR